MPFWHFNDLRLNCGLLSSVLTKNIRKYFLPALLLVTVLISLLKPASDTLYSYAGHLQNKLNAAESFFQQQGHSESVRRALMANYENGPAIENIEKQGLLLFFYKDDSLRHWTSNHAALLTSPDSLSEGTSLLRLKNGWYQAMKYTDTATREIFIALMPVKYQYPFENKFLRNDFAPRFNVPPDIEISPLQIAGSVPVKSLGGKVLFSIYESAGGRADTLNIVLLLAQLLLVLVVFYYMHRLAVYLVGRNGFAAGFIFLVIAVIVTRGFMLWYDQPSEFYLLDLFSPKNYASSVITPSLGDLVINSLILLWLVLFWITYRAPQTGKVLPANIMAGLLIALVFAAGGLVTWVFKTLVMDSTISFEVYNVLSLNFYSLLGMLCVTVILLSHFFITQRVVHYLDRAQIKFIYVLLFSLVSAGIFGLFAIGSLFFETITFTAIWNVALIFIFSVIMCKHPPPPVSRVILYVAFYSLLCTFLIENLYERRERAQRRFFASQLVSERDFVAEYMFDDVAQHIASDAFIKNFFSSSSIPKREVDDRLSSVYLSGYFNKYELKVYTYDKRGYALRSRDTIPLRHFHSLLRSDSVRPGELYYETDSAQNYSYYAFFRYYNDTSFTGTLVLQLIPKVYYGQNVYPELLLGDNMSTLSDYSYYDYAIYQHDKLIIQHGDFPYTYNWDKDLHFGDKQYAYIDVGDWEHIIYRFTNDKKVIVTIAEEGLFEPIATFSYLFSFFFVVVAIITLVRRFWRSRNGGLLDWFTLSFRTRINYSMLLMIIISFVIIGLITISFFRKQYDNFYSDRLQRKEKVVHASLEYFIQQNLSNENNVQAEHMNNALGYEVSRLAEINDIDINLYDKDGNMAVASQPAIYDKGIISGKMNPDAYFNLVNTQGAQITEREGIGGLKYLATYAPVRNNAGQTIAYLGIPYFARSKDINDEVSSFLVALMNVYVFLLICAAILAFFISNSITRPLTIISEKLRILNLNKKNEPIEWKSHDEIGVLIGEYNKMIEELEKSAYKLARSERESAWREMAKQIAHEIKNPLTPMKLSIQYLQRAIDAGQPNIEELAARVARTLEEQIENLSSIATAFSSFAKMPKAQNEIINLNELLRSIAVLFDKEEKITVSFNPESGSPLVFADKNQLVSVFNNLIKNASQSIPEGRQGFVDIHVKEEREWITVAISDNGGGIPHKLYEQVFVPNFTTKSSGTGLGLAISRQIIEGAGGKIWFESAENVGTTFFVQLKKN